MPKYTKVAETPRPYYRSSHQLAPTGTSDVITALSDGSDSTYGKATVANAPADYSTGWPSLGAGERIVSVCPYCRSSRPGSKNVSLACGAIDLEAARLAEGVKLSLGYSASITNAEIAAQNGQLLDPLSGGEWYARSLYAPLLSFLDPHTSDANRALWREAGLYLYATKEATIAAPSSPASSVTDTQYPTLTATVSAIVESWQVPAGLAPFLCGVLVEFALYAGTMTTPSGSPVWTIQTQATISAYGDGVTPSTLAVSATPPKPIENGSYTLFARVVREHPSAEYSDDSGWSAWSSWSYKQFTVNVPLPATPTLNVQPNAGQYVYVRATAPATSGYTAFSWLAHVQRQVGGVWRDVRGMVDVPHTEDVSLMSVGADGHDYEADRGVTNTYRIRVSALHTASGTRRYSAWATAATTGYSLTGWNLKTVDAPAGNWLAAPLSDPSESSQAPSAVLEPLDRDRPIVLVGELAGMAGSFVLSAAGAAAIAKLETIAAYRGRILLEDAFGGSRYIGITKVAWTRAGTADDPRRTAAIEYAEISSGLDTVAS